MNNKAYNRILYCTLCIFLLILVVLLGNSCTIKKNVQKTSESTNIHTTETATTTTIESGTLITKSDSTEVEFIADKPVTVVTNLPGIVTTTTFDPKTKVVKTKTVQKPLEVPISRTIHAITNKTLDVTHEKKTYDKRKKTDYLSWWWLLLIPLYLLARKKWNWLP